MSILGVKQLFRFGKSRIVAVLGMFVGVITESGV